MRRTYPYLQDSYVYNSNSELVRRRFLQSLEGLANQKQYVKITLLNWNEDPIKDLEGILTSGSISKDGNSAVRRTCSFTCTVGYGEYDIQLMESDFAINKKVFIELGIKNETNEYLEFPILWFPQGVFFISSFSCNSAVGSGVNLSIGLKDKMAGLNGDVGGVFPATTTLDQVITQLSTGEEVIQKTPIYSIIQEMVNHYGKEPLTNIVIEDIPARIRKVMKWTGDNPVYLVQSSENYLPIPEETDPERETFDNMPYYQFSLIKPDDNSDYLTFEYGDDIGYIMSDFVIPDELVAAAGTSVTQALDEIKNILGNYEYFYDVMGIFHFREIKNYVNTTQGKLVLNESSQNQYLVENNNGKSEYLFDDVGNITSINVTPNYDNIKNDYVILGLRQSEGSDISYEVRYHLAIDEKPQWYVEDNIVYYGKFPDANSDEDGNFPESSGHVLVFYSEKLNNLYTGNIVAGFPYINAGGNNWHSIADFPAIGNMDALYYDEQDNKVYRWNGTGYEPVGIWNEETQELEEPVIYRNSIYYIKDWRTLLYLKGKYASVNGTDPGFYYEELNAHWPTVYDLINQRFYAEDPNGRQLYDNTNPTEPSSDSKLWRTLTDGNYYLDFIDAASSDLGRYSVNAIGRRTLVVQDDKINCLFQPEIPNVNILNIDDVSANSTTSTMLPQYGTLAEQRQESIDNGWPFTQVGNEIYSHLSIGGHHKAAYDEIKYQLYLHTNYQRQLSLTSLPAFYLEPNTRITVNEKSTNTFGDFVISNVGLTFGPGANMSISASEVFERI